MSRETVFRHALNCLARPATLLAAALLLLNALVLQPRWPSWWTGKIGDAAWLVLAPLLVAPALAWLLPARIAGNSRRLGAAALLATGAAYALAKTVPWGNGLIVAALAQLGVAAKLALDPTDLLALPALGLAWRVWNQETVRRAPMPARLAGLLLGLLAVVADTSGASNIGIVCVGQSGSIVFAVTDTTPSGYFGKHTERVLHSEDGGLTWTEVSSEQVAGDQLPHGNQARCAKDVWPLADPNDANVVYYRVEGGGLYRSTDGGQTLSQERAENATPFEATSAVMDKATGHLIVAAGRSGVLVRNAEGEWEAVTMPLGPGR